MRITNVKISGFRKFVDFHVSDDDSSGFVILAGGNGSGKSTVLEIIDYIVSGTPNAQVMNNELLSAIIDDKLIWSVSVCFSEQDLQACVKRLKLSDPMGFSLKEEDLLVQIKSNLRMEGDVYHATLSMEIQKVREPNYVPNIEFIGSTKEEAAPFWYRTLGGTGYFTLVFKPNSQIQDGNLTLFNVDPSNLLPSQIVNGGRNISQRSEMSSVQMGTLLSQLTLKNIWSSFQNSGGSLDTVKNWLSKINQLINPLEIVISENGLEIGNVFFVLRNKITRSEYTLSFASSGEKHVIGLAAAMILWRETPFKSIVLIDEPEVHLHPSFVERLGIFFNEIFVGENNFTCILATHSADLIASNPDRVYQISANGETITKISNLTDRINLLQRLGKKFELDFLVRKMIWVEGITGSSKDHLQDHEVYQSLVDPYKTKIVFLPAGVEPLRWGSKGGAERAINGAAVFTAFLDSLEIGGNGIDIFALVDRDDDKKLPKSKLVKQTPFKNLENIFLLDQEAISHATDGAYSIDRINELLLSITSDNLMDVDGKAILEKLHSAIYPEAELSLKTMQQKILVNIKISRLPKEVQDLFEDLLS